MSVRQTTAILIGICLLPIMLSACNKSSLVSTSTTGTLSTLITPTISPEPSLTPVPPTPTPVPLAAIVNGEGITLDEFEGEITRFQASSTITGTKIASDTNTIVLNELIDQTLLAQAAVENGYSMDEAVLQSRISTLEDQLGGAEALINWQAAHGYTEDDFIKALKRSIEAAWMRDQIIATVPETADEVHVLQILVPTENEANQVYESLQSGKDFLDLAVTYNPMTKGDLGWFPRSYIRDAAIEEAAFALQPGKYSKVIKTDTGFHILYLLERDAEHTLQPDARRVLQEKALQGWINQRRSESEIEILLP